MMEEELLTGEFEVGQRGLICRYPSDDGAYIVPDRRSQPVQPDVEYVLEVTGQTASGNLRFARSLGTVQEYYLRRHGAAIKAALNDPQRVGPNTYPDPNVIVIDVEGLGRVWYRVSADGSRLERDSRLPHDREWLPSLPMTEPAKQAHKASQQGHEEMRAQAEEAMKIRAEKEREENERRAQAFRDHPPMTQEEVQAIAAKPGSEEGPLGQWPRARLDQSPEAGDLIRVDSHWYVAVAGYRREGTKGSCYGGLYSRWVQVPENVCRDW